MDRNLGAEQLAENKIDRRSFGLIYRWNQLKPYPGTFDKTPWDPKIWGNELINYKPGSLENIQKSEKAEWSNEGWERINNPCPSGFDIPTKSEWEAEKIQSSSDAFDKLRLPLSMYRASEGYTQGFGWETYEDGFYKPTEAGYWSRTTYGDLFLHNLWLNVNTWTKTDSANMGFVANAYGFSIRCIKNHWSTFTF